MSYHTLTMASLETDRGVPSVLMEASVGKAKKPIKCGGFHLSLNGAFSGIKHFP